MKKKIVGEKNLKETLVLLITISLFLSSGFAMASTEIEEQIPVLIDAGECGGISDGSGPSLLGEETIGYYDPDSVDNDALGIYGGVPPYTWEAAIRLTSDELEPYDGWELRAAHFYYHETMGHSGSLKIYDEGTPTSPGELIASRPYTTSYTGWQRIDLLNFVTIDATKDLWISIEIISYDNEHPISIDAGPAVEGKGDWIYFFGDWYEIPDLNPNFASNWCIEGVVAQGESTETELEITDVKGIVGVKTIINNKGTYDAINVIWSIKVAGGLLSRVNMTASGSITNLANGSEETVRSGIFFGFGRVEITIYVEAANADIVTKEATGFVLGPFVFGVKP